MAYFLQDACRFDSGPGREWMGWECKEYLRVPFESNDWRQEVGT